MTRPRFLADEDYRFPYRSSGKEAESLIEIATVQELGLSGTKDEILLEYTWQEQWLVLSNDKSTMIADVIKRFEAGEHIHGAFFSDQNVSRVRMVESIITIYETTDFSDWFDRIVYLPL